MRRALALLLLCGPSWARDNTFLKHKTIHVAGGALVGYWGVKTHHEKMAVGIALGAGMLKEWADERSGERYKSRARDVAITSAPAMIVVRIRW